MSRGSQWLPNSSKSKASPRTAWVVVGVVFLAFIFGGDWFTQRMQYFMNPWADPNSGKPIVLGTWVGQFTTGRGLPRAVLLHLRVNDPNDVGRRGRGRRSWRAHIEGTGAMCEETGRVLRYDIYGHPADGKARRINLGLTPADSVPKDGLQIDHVAGAWDGGDALQADVSLHLRKGKSAISNTADPDTGPDHRVPMTRSTEAEFRALCGRLRARGMTAG